MVASNPTLPSTKRSMHCGIRIGLRALEHTPTVALSASSGLGLRTAFAISRHRVVGLAAVIRDCSPPLRASPLTPRLAIARALRASPLTPPRPSRHRRPEAADLRFDVPGNASDPGEPLVALVLSVTALPTF